MILYGWENKIKQMLFLGKFYCPSCGKFTNYYIAKRVFRNTLFFILFSGGRENTILCVKIVQEEKQFPKDEAKQLLQQKQTMYTVEQLDLIMKDALAEIQNGNSNAQKIVAIMIQKYQLDKELDYIKEFIYDICQIYGTIEKEIA